MTTPLEQAPRVLREAKADRQASQAGRSLRNAAMRMHTHCIHLDKVHAHIYGRLVACQRLLRQCARGTPANTAFPVLVIVTKLLRGLTTGGGTSLHQGSYRQLIRPARFMSGP